MARTLPGSVAGSLNKIDMAARSSLGLIESRLRTLRTEVALSDEHVADVDLMIDLAFVAANDINVLCEHARSIG
jgi:hypothetical protein